MLAVSCFQIFAERYGPAQVETRQSEFTEITRMIEAKDDNANLKFFLE
jgi:hypothetical protein